MTKQWRNAYRLRYSVSQVFFGAHLHENILEIKSPTCYTVPYSMGDNY